MNYMQLKNWKTFPFQVKIAIKRKNENGSDRPTKNKNWTNFDDDTPPGTQWDGDNYSCCIRCPYLLFCSTYGQQNPKNGKRYSKSPINIFFTLHDGFQKYLRGCEYFLKAARDSVLNYSVWKMILFFFLLDIQAVVSLHWATQMFYPVYKVPQLHLECSHCNNTIMINSNRIGKTNACGPIVQQAHITNTWNHMHHHHSRFVATVNAPLESTIHFSETHKKYMPVDGNWQKWSH